MSFWRLLGRSSPAVLCLLVAVIVAFGWMASWRGVRLNERRVAAFAPQEMATQQPASEGDMQAGTSYPVANQPPAALTPDYQLPPIASGLAPVLSTIPTTQPVVFLGIDDGISKQPQAIQMMRDNDIKATLFLTYDAIRDNPDYFKELIDSGSLVENHTLTHRQLNRLNYEQQTQEICGAADLYEQLYARRPILFRPPYGSYNATTQRAAADSGMKAVILRLA